MRAALLLCARHGKQSWALQGVCIKSTYLKCFPEFIDSVKKYDLGRIVKTTSIARPATTPGLPDAPGKMLWSKEWDAISTKHFCCDPHSCNGAVCAWLAHSNFVRNDLLVAFVVVPLVDAVAHPYFLPPQEILQGQCLETIMWTIATLSCLIWFQTKK